MDGISLEFLTYRNLGMHSATAETRSAVSGMNNFLKSG